MLAVLPGAPAGKPPVLAKAPDPPGGLCIGEAPAEGKGGPAGVEATDELALFLLRFQPHLYPPGPLWQPASATVAPTTITA